MGQIQVMPASLANQIAAGEVVERPASCVKELIENSLDAGAKQLRVSLEDGGITRIVVQDDGSGMDEEDVSLAFARHATSKLRTARDLFRVHTLGFRGEALASIAAVARVTLSTRQASAPSGLCLTVSGSVQSGPPSPIGMPPGTRIEVADLFYNTPARLKYLRALATEQSRCLEVIQRAALSRPDVSFQCEINGQIAFSSPGDGNVRSVLAALYGVGEARQFLPVQGETQDYRLEAWIGRPNQAKASRVHGYLFVNGRAIRNIAVHQAVVAGYQSRLMVNRHPMYALYVNMDPTLVDVNVHPHKSEVRFSEERDLVQLVQHEVKAALDQAFLVPEVHVARQSGSASWQSRLVESPSPARNWSAGLAERVRETYAPTETKHPQPQDVQSSRAAPESSTTITGTDSVTLSTPPADDLPVSTFGRRLRLVGQAMGSYMVAEDGDNLYIIDQHAAHERVLFERFTDRLKSEGGRAIPLLTPIPMGVSPAQKSLLAVHRDALSEIGLQFDDFGGQDVLLRSIPDIWDGLDAIELADAVIQSLTDVGRVPDVLSFLRDHVVLKACKAAVKANHRMSEIELSALCEALSGLEDPFHCPHGRPTAIRLTSRDLEKEFRRIV